MEAGSADRPLRCRDCGTDFIWTAKEQAFYAAKGLLNAPSRCASCRTIARAARESGQRRGPARAREQFPAVCARCGVQTQVPFSPREDKPVYCSACYDRVRSSRTEL